MDCEVCIKVDSSMEQPIGDIIPSNQQEQSIRREEPWYDDRGLDVPHQQEIHASYCKYETDMGEFIIPQITHTILLNLKIMQIK